jgi:hypothetical protein
MGIFERGGNTMKAVKFVFVLVLMLSLTIPALAGNGPGGPGGGGDIPDTGELFGDLYVILRDVNGVPILDGNGCIQPISSITGSVTIETIDGPLTIEAYVDEPFTLAFYTDTAGDLVECELTEEMANWVQTVDFGRLNLGRSPESVIAHALDEAINKMNVATAMKLDAAGRLVLTLPDEENEGLFVDKTIDAPAENLALYIKLMQDGHWITVNVEPIVKGGPPEGKGPPEGDGPSAEPRPVLNESAAALLTDLGFANLGDETKTTADLDSPHLTLAASLLAAAADKTGSITLDKVVYINSIYGINQLGSLPGEVEGKTYFNFGAYSYDRGATYAYRGSEECIAFGTSWVWVLQPELDADGVEVPDHFVTTCMDLLGYEVAHDPAVNSVHFTDMVEEYTMATDADGNPITGFDFINNVRAFTQAADDALQVIEYIHNYKIPEVLYP